MNALEYRDLYLTVILYLVPFILFYCIGTYNGFKQRKYSAFLSWSLALFAIIMYGSRSFEFGADTESYLELFDDYKFNIAANIGQEPGSKDIGWYTFTYLSAFVLNARGFLYICAVVFIVPLFLAFKKIFGSDMLMPFFIFLCSSLSMNYGTNVVRTGIAFAFFCIMIASNKKLITQVLFGLLAAAFHLSFILPVLLWFLFSRVRVKSEYLLLLWFGCLVLFVFSGNSFNIIFSYLNLDLLNARVESYLTSNIDYRTGFRLDFVSYSFFFLVIGLYLRRKVYTDKFYDTLLNTYIVTNAFFLLSMNIPFSDRFAGLSWCLIPILCSYPFIKADIKKHIFKLTGFAALMIVMFIFQTYK